MFLFFIKVHVFWERQKFCEIFTLLLSYVALVKSKVKISQNFVAFSEYMNFTNKVFAGHFCSILYLAIKNIT